jgi:hypothetical protein
VPGLLCCFTIFVQFTLAENTKGAVLEQSAIFAPFFSMILLTFGVWIYMYSRRIPFIILSKLPPEELTPASPARLSPPQVANPSDNLKNLFELPAIFYALVLYLYVTSQADVLYVGAAWVFVGFRFLHSGVHCTINIVVLRFWLYCISALALWFMAGRAVLHLFS